MKQYVYQIKGELTPEEIELIKPLLPPSDRVSITEIHPTEGDLAAFIEVEWASSPSSEETTAWENSMDTVLRQSTHCELILPALSPRYIAKPPSEKKGKKISLNTAIGTVITAVILAVLLTFAVTTSFIQGSTPTQVAPGTGTTDDRFGQLEALDRLFRVLSPLELDDQALLDTVLKAYVYATGDQYANYYTEEEFEAYKESQSGDMVGIGVNVVENTITVGEAEYTTITIVNVFPDSPAEEAGVLAGDHIMYIGSGDDRVLVHSVGYDKAATLMSGEAGTLIEFEVFRPSDTAATGYDSVMISATRRQLQSRSVYSRVCATDASVGIIRITSFAQNTAQQFVDAMDNLQAHGCTRFVLDLRGNTGGLLTSVVDMLTYFSRVGDKVISIKDKNGTEENIVISDAVSQETGQLLTGSCTLEPSDIGKYRNLTFSVLTNEYTASAAELFAANIRDYQLGKLVGVTTYGKGSIQTFVSMKAYGYDGALKITYGYYYPPSGKSYHDIGIEPDIYEPLSEEARSYNNLNLLPDDKDNQLQKAIEALETNG